MSSVRATPETLGKNPPKRRMIQPGLYIADPPAKNWNASPQGNGYYRLTLAAAQHQSIDVQWWIMVPRGTPATWFEVAPGKIELPIGITPTPGTPYAAQHRDDRGVFQHIYWDLTVDVPTPVKLPSMADVTTSTFNEVALLSGVTRYLDMGVEDVRGTLTAKHSIPEDVSIADFAKAVDEHALFWQLGDIDFQIRNGATLGADGQEVPAASLSYHSAVTDDTLKRIAERPNVQSVWLRGTPITDAGLVHLKALKKLEHLDLAETQITDAGLAHLKEILSLKRLDLTGTNVTANAVISLKSFSPNLEIEGP